MTWKEFQNSLKGKVFLIGLIFTDDEGELIEQYQTHGTVEELTNEGIFKLIRDDGSLFQMPYDKDTIRIAKEGQYRERSSGDIIANPDFIMTWEIITKKSDNLDDIKQMGLIPARK